MSKSRYAILPALLAGAIAMPAAAELIDTTALMDATIFPFGEPNTATYGQTFTVGVDNVLDSFTFLLNDGATPVNFRAYVYAWDGSKASGAALYSSAPMATTGAAGFEAMTANTGGLALLTGQQYVAFFSVTGLEDGNPDDSDWGAVSGSSVYAGGGFVFINNGSDASMWTTATWNQDWLCTGCDLAFRMELSSGGQVPVPGALLLAGLGLLGLGASSRRRT